MFVLVLTGVSTFSANEVYGAKVVHSGENTNLSWKLYSDGKLTINGTGDANRSYRYNDVIAYEWVEFHNV